MGKDTMIRYRGFVIISHDDGRYFTISGHKGHWYSLDEAETVCDQIRPREQYPTKEIYPVSLFEQPAVEEQPTPTPPPTPTPTPTPTEQPVIYGQTPTETPTPTPTPTTNIILPIALLIGSLFLASLFFGKRRRR